jgi:hypothetical protein
MKYNLVLAYNAPCYAEVEIEAESDAEAEAKAKAIAKNWEVGYLVFAPHHDLCDDLRIADLVSEETGESLIESLPIDEIK